MPHKRFENLSPLDETDLNTYLMRQTVMKFESITQRNSVLTGADAPDAGTLCFIENLNVITWFDGVNWYGHFTAMTLGTNVIVYNGTTSYQVAARCFKALGGVVHTEGYLRANAALAANAILATFPSGYRPAQSQVFNCPATVAAGFVRCDIDTSGNIRPQAALGSGVDVSINGLTFVGGA